MTPTLTRPRPTQQALGSRLLVGAGVAVIVAVGLILGPGVRAPGMVEQLSITNPSLYSVQVDVTGADHDGWLNLGTVNRESTRRIQAVLDQGSRWVFRFRSGGHDGGELVVPRSALRGDGWKLEIPPEVAERLAAANVPPSVY